MPTYTFTAKQVGGKVVSGELDAANDVEARVKLRSQRLMPVKVRPKSAAKGGGGQSLSIPFLNPDPANQGVKAKDLQVFTRQFAVLVNAGVPVMQSLESMSQGGRSPALTNALQVVTAEVGKGKRLAEAMAMRPKVFDDMYRNLVRAGEEGGVLDEVLDRLAEYIEKAAALRGKVTGALWYPAAIILVAFAVIAAIMTFVIPQFVEMFGSMDQELPGQTVMVIDLSNFFVDFWWAIIAVLVAVPSLFKGYYNTEDGRKVLDEIFLKLPLFGGLIQKGGIAKMCRTLSTLLGAGVRIMDSIDIAATTAGNWCLERDLLKAKDAVAKGKNLADPLTASPHFPQMVCQMIRVGEDTGNLDAMLGKIADFYEDEVEATAEAMTSLIEPLLMVGLGGIIAVIVIAMYLPIFNLAGAVGG
ncbi:MAG: type II secretion system F family protein [Bdellovibrionales bacterium]|nr:type II secretion system F family protein [Bdellovibrionales bacterium]